VTEPATLNRPSPRPREAVVRPLHAVPDPNPAITETASREDTPSDHETAGQSGSPESAGPGWVAGLQSRWTAIRDYWTPPAIFTDQPASLAELAAYARTAPWTAQQKGPIRALGVWHYRLVGFPYTVISRYREWLAQRPLRLIAALGLVKLVALTGPGHWLIHTIVYPVAQLAGHLFL
jgi:hypothetical protein